MFTSSRKFVADPAAPAPLLAVCRDAALGEHAEVAAGHDLEAEPGDVGHQVHDRAHALHGRDAVRGAGEREQRDREVRQLDLAVVHRHGVIRPAGPGTTA